MTIKIKSAHPASQGPFVLIDKASFDPKLHEPFDDEARAALAGADGERLPTKAELLDARDHLVQMRADLDAEAVRLDAQAAAQAELQAQLDDRAKALADAEAAASTEQVEKLSIGKLRDALTQKGIEFPKGAKAADLQALLDAAA